MFYINVKKTNNKMNRKRNKEIISPEEVLIIVCDRFNLTPKEIFYNSKEKEICLARQFYFAVCYTNCKDSLDSVGRLSLKYSNRKPFNFSTVAHAHKMIVDQSTIYKKTKRILKELLCTVETKYLINQMQEEKNKNFNESTFLVDNINLIELTR
ncbi:DnaA protein [Cellulophaga phage phi10:1]|uniref:DnaA protein n=1 Tax=Cellulophaga phage phi10:1 TaxID=1327981 RepID=S0A0N5_9CAUD|nr:DnaA protein [Cellulophaga phage phi10:1]AGO48375.1 DnaA protein [Cellulophaga phage phi10:1]